MRRDLMNNINPATPSVSRIADNTAAKASANMAGYASLTFIVAAGTLVDADATFAATMQESDTGAFGGEETQVDASQIIGTLALASFTFAADNKCFKIGYNGTKLYAQLTVTPANNGGNADLAIIPVLGHPDVAPTANPPA